MAHQQAQYAPLSLNGFKDPLKSAGHVLEIIPDRIGMVDSERRMCCGALECFGCIYTMDLCCTIPTMRRIEPPKERYNMLRLPFYEACWPCMCLASCIYPDSIPGLRIISDMFVCPWGSLWCEKNCNGIFKCCIEDEPDEYAPYIPG